MKWDVILASASLAGIGSYLVWLAIKAFWKAEFRGRFLGVATIEKQPIGFALRLLTLIAVASLTYWLAIGLLTIRYA